MALVDIRINVKDFILSHKKAFDHLRFMDFSVLPGKPGYYLWKFGVISFWHRYILKRYRLPKNDLKSRTVTAYENLR